MTHTYPVFSHRKESMKMDEPHRTVFQCRECRCLWRRNEDGTYSVIVTAFSPCSKCDNGSEFPQLLEPPRRHLVGGWMLTDAEEMRIAIAALSERAQAGEKTG